ncbi:hypothetical protein [Massilia sp. S19_KUP03_FR1]|uniref:hypothetical protein n=1 Tax=Massilia sp. S19_KUP03_FR1 TaxID=3025503 RepID=UPI002FCD8E50
MHKLIKELIRLYLAPGAAIDGLAQRIDGSAVDAVDLAGADGAVRAIVIPFRKMRSGDEAAHWTLLCDVANALQSELDLPAPAVSVSGTDGYGLWLSLANPVAPALAQEFVALLRQAYFSDVKVALDAASTLVALPPCLNPESGKWAAFIHPGMGASFADESGLEMAPPLSGQVAFLEGLHSIDAAQFDAALAVLRQKQSPAPAAPARSTPAAPGAPADLLLKDATLEDIVAFLHAKNIEPTFRHLLR